MTAKFTRAKSIAVDTALKIIQANREDKDYRLTKSEISYVGDPNGRLWTDSEADRLSAALSNIQRQTQESGYGIPERQEFDRRACKVVHENLDLTPEILADPGFWRWLSVAKLSHVVEARHRTRANYAGLDNFGITGPAEDNHLFILWLRSDIVYDENNSDPYHLSTRLSSNDFWRSGIIRTRYGWALNLARAFVEFEYPGPDSGKATLRIGSKNGVRMLYKRLKRLHAIIAFEHMPTEKIISILETNSVDLDRG